LKRNAVPIPFNQVTASNKNIQNDENKEEQREQREIKQMEQVPHCGQANKRIQSTEVVASTSDVSNSNANVIADKRLERYPLQYRAPRLYFDTSMEEEDITEWMHIESPLHDRVVTPLPLNKSTENEENKLCLELSTHEKVLKPLSNKYV